MQTKPIKKQNTLLLLNSWLFKAFYNCGSQYLFPSSCKQIHGFKNVEFENGALLLSIYDATNKDGSVFCFQTLNNSFDIFVEWWSWYFLVEKQLIDSGQLSMIITTFRPLCSVPTGQVSSSWKASWFLGFAYNEHWQLLTISICCSYSILFFLPKISPLSDEAFYQVEIGK